MTYVHGRAIAALLLALGSAPLVATPAGATNDPKGGDDDQAVDVASVKLELKQENGKVFTHDGAIFDWGADGDIVITQDDHRHSIALRIDRPQPQGKKIKLTIAYSRDGTPIIAPYEMAAEIKKRAVLRIEGGAAIAITVTPKTLGQDNHQEAPRDKIKGPGEDTNNPLDGI